MFLATREMYPISLSDSKTKGKKEQEENNQRETNMNQQTSGARAAAVSSSATFAASIENEKTAVLIPKTTAERIRKRLQKSDFKTVDDYVSYVMEQVLDDIEKREKTEEEEREATKNPNRGKRKEDERESEASNFFSKEDEENVEQRLKDLGYL